MLFRIYQLFLKVEQKNFQEISMNIFLEAESTIFLECQRQEKHIPNQVSYKDSRVEELNITINFIVYNLYYSPNQILPHIIC